MDDIHLHDDGQGGRLNKTEVWEMMLVQIRILVAPESRPELLATSNSTKTTYKKLLTLLGVIVLVEASLSLSSIASDLSIECCSVSLIVLGFVFMSKPYRCNLVSHLIERCHG